MNKRETEQLKDALDVVALNGSTEDVLYLLSGMASKQKMDVGYAASRNKLQDDTAVEDAAHILVLIDQLVITQGKIDSKLEQKAVPPKVEAAAPCREPQAPMPKQSAPKPKRTERWSPIDAIKDFFFEPADENDEVIKQ